MIFRIFFFNEDHFKSLYQIYYIIVSVLCFDFLSLRHNGILPLWPGIKPVSPALEGEILTTAPPRKSLLPGFE